MTAQNWNRRDFLKTAGSTVLGALSAGAPVAFANEESRKIPASTADSLILLWMGGGMASTETFDPKPHVPFERGMDPRRVLSTFPSIDTAVDSIKFSAGLEHMSAMMDRGRLDSILHGRRSGIHSPFPTSIPLAHRICAAPNRRRSPYRRGDFADAWPAQPGSARLY